MAERKEYFEWINIARGIGMVLIVFGHGLICVGPFSRFTFQFIYSFHMPLIFFLSGFVSDGILRSQTTGDKIAFCKKRAIKLMVPYFSVGIIYIFLDKLMGITDLYDNGIIGVFVYMLKGDNPNWQLWTLYALFGCALISIITARHNLTILITIAIVFQIVYCTPLVHIGNCTIVSYVQKYLLYYVGGLSTRKIINSKKQILDITHAKIIALISAIVLIVLNVGIYFWGEQRWVHILTGPLGIYIICYTAKKIQGSNSLWNKLFNVVGSNGMDIYILANLVQNAVEEILFNYMNLNEWATALISLVVGVAVPIIVSKYVIRKMRFTRILILGS